MAEFGTALQNAQGVLTEKEADLHRHSEALTVMELGLTALRASAAYAHRQRGGRLRHLLNEIGDWPKLKPVDGPAAGFWSNNFLGDFKSYYWTPVFTTQLPSGEAAEVAIRGNVERLPGLRHRRLRLETAMPNGDVFSHGQISYYWNSSHIPQARASITDKHLIGKDKFDNYDEGFWETGDPIDPESGRAEFIFDTVKAIAGQLKQ